MSTLDTKLKELINISFDTKEAIDSINSNSAETKTFEEKVEESKLIQQVIEAKRKIESKIVTLNNKGIIAKLFSESKLKDFDKNNDVIYESSYLPNVELYLTKDSINKIALSSDVDSIYCKSDLVYDFEDSNEESVSVASASDEYDNADFGNFYRYTGLSTNRDAFGLSGYNVKVGICDGTFCSLEQSKVYFTNSAIAGYMSDDIFDEVGAPRHGDMVADILAGQYKDSDGNISYKGIVPNAKLYLANAGKIDETNKSDVNKYKSCFEYFASQGCSVINMSRWVGDDAENTYGDTSKWIDSFINRYNIHVVMSAGNIDGDQTGVTSGKMSYNSIVVGSCDKDGVIATNSCYSSSNTKAYKPDMVAYGVNVNIPTNPNGVSGTSCATPMVTGLVAQMCQLSATLRANPTLMKAVVINSSRRKSVLTSDTYLSTDNAISYPINHKYGVGVMYAPDAYVMVNDKNYFGVGTMSSDENSVEFEQQISAKSTNKLVRIVVNVKNTYPELSLETVRLQVTDPKGNVYTSQYKYDTKQIVSIKPGTSGMYKIKLERLNGTNYNLDYAISYNVIAE